MKANKTKAIRLMNRHVLCVTLLLAGVTASVAAPPPAPGRSGVGGGKAVLRPASDPANTGDWILNQETSDESEGRSLDAPPRETKWNVTEIMKL